MTYVLGEHWQRKRGRRSARGRNLRGHPFRRPRTVASLCPCKIEKHGIKG